jgi:membrane associated rhomboid family serine protease
MVLAWFAHLPTGDMSSWGVSAAVLARGQYENVLLHMFAHGGWLHLVLNSLALIEIGSLVVARLGSFPKGWARALVGFALSGLSSMISYLSFHPGGEVPMIGASGAVYGLMGLLLGMRLIEELESVRVSQILNALVRFVRNNGFFLLLLLIGGVLSGAAGGIAWEAHAGGFLLGLCVGPWLLPLTPKALG